MEHAAAGSSVQRPGSLAVRPGIDSDAVPPTTAGFARVYTVVALTRGARLVPADPAAPSKGDRRHGCRPGDEASKPVGGLRAVCRSQRKLGVPATVRGARRDRQETWRGPGWPRPGDRPMRLGMPVVRSPGTPPRDPCSAIGIRPRGPHRGLLASPGTARRCCAMWTAWTSCPPDGLSLETAGPT